MEYTILLQEFDSSAFGVPFYRIKDFDPGRLAAALPARTASAPAVIDAKIPAHDQAAGWCLMDHGFRKVCTQFELIWTARPLAAPPPATVAVSDRLPLGEAEIAEHARNFVWDRFSLDRRLPREGIARLYGRWMANSLSGRRRVVHAGRNFCTFAEADGLLKIDLLSVLDKHRGIGRQLLAALQAHAQTVGAQAVTVTTECENEPAWRLYTAAGFQPLAFHSVFHFVAPGTF